MGRDGDVHDVHDVQESRRVISRRYGLVLPRNSRRHLRLDCQSDPDVLVREHITVAAHHCAGSPLRLPSAVQRRPASPSRPSHTGPT